VVAIAKTLQVDVHLQRQEDGRYMVVIYGAWTDHTLPPGSKSVLLHHEAYNGFPSGPAAYHYGLCRVLALFANDEWRMR
jgi:hypothetical protein